MFLNIGFIFFMRNIISYHPVVECVLDMFLWDLQSNQYASKRITH